MGRVINMSRSEAEFLVDHLEALPGASENITVLNIADALREAFGMVSRERGAEVAREAEGGNG